MLRALCLSCPASWAGFCHEYPYSSPPSSYVQKLEVAGETQATHMCGNFNKFVEMELKQMQVVEWWLRLSWDTCILY